MTSPATSSAKVTFRDGERRWTEVHEFNGSILELQTAVRLHALRNGWRIVGFAPISYGR